MKIKKLFPYQKKVFDLVLNALKSKGKALMVMAPGLGKTVVSSFLTKELYVPGKKVLFLCHDSYILTQANEEFKKTFDTKNELKFHNFFGSIKKHRDCKEADVVFGSFQSLNSKSKWYREFRKDHFDIIVVDEGHHVQAKTFKEVVKYFKPRLSLCMTGTPDRSDNLNIRDLYGDEVVHITIEEGIAKGWLSKVEYHVLSDGLSDDALKKMFEEVVEEKQRISLSQINSRLFIKKRDIEQINLIRKYTRNGAKKSIIFCNSIHHLRSFAKKLPRGTYTTFHSQNSDTVNTNNLNKFKAGSVNTILSVDKFNEGIDVPNVEVIVFLRCTESGIIYRQQLGRGLRIIEGKSKVIVLDFVGNIDRMLMVQGMMKNIEQFKGPVGSDKSLLSISGKNYSFDFADQLHDISEILRVARMGFYETWQEASVSAKKIGLRSQTEYNNGYKIDHKLPSSPYAYYKDFPGWFKFLGNKEENFYDNWQEASIAALALDIRTSQQYKAKFKVDPKLHSNPAKHYKDFPNWFKFLGNKEENFYSNWYEASIAILKLKITDGEMYSREYKKDPRLPRNPDKFYKDFPGWLDFFGKKKNYYRTLNQIKRVLKKSKIDSRTKYNRFRKNDLRLPPLSNLGNYDGYTSWLELSGKDPRGIYKTLKKATIALNKLKLNVTSSVDYNQVRHLDSRLPHSLYYYKDFPGWPKFIDKK